MKLKIFKGKKGQYYPQMVQPRSPYQNISLILILGIGIVILKFLLPSFGIKGNFEWLFFVGLIVILIGGGHSIMKSLE